MNRQKNIKVVFLFIAIIFALIACNSNLIHHNPEKAGRIAQFFCETIFVNQDFGKAKAFLSEEAIKKTQEKKNGQFTKEIHPSQNYPKIILLKDYEPIPTTKKIKIYLEGIGNNDEKHYYCLVMILTKNGTYRVDEIYKSKENEPFPKSNLRKPILELIVP